MYQMRFSLNSLMLSTWKSNKISYWLILPSHHAKLPYFWLCQPRGKLTLCYSRQTECSEALDQYHQNPQQQDNKIVHLAAFWHSLSYFFGQVKWNFIYFDSKSRFPSFLKYDDIFWYYSFYRNHPNFQIYFR